MSIVYPYFGDVEFSRATVPTALNAPKLVMASGSRRINLIDFTDGYFTVSPIQWTPEEKEYDFISLTGLPISRITGWRASVNVKMNLAGRKLFRKTMQGLGNLADVKYTFGATGVTTDRSFFFYPAGDLSRISFAVVLDIDVLRSEHFGGKLIGYKDLEFTLVSVLLYDRPQFAEPDIVAGKIAYGVPLTGVAIRNDPRVL